MVNYDQPIRKQPLNNAKPNISFGVEFTSSSHAFQIFMGNFGDTLPQNNNAYNQNDFRYIGQYLIGFNITRLWN
jgi:hypothetical protein